MEGKDVIKSSDKLKSLTWWPVETKVKTFKNRCKLSYITDGGILQRATYQVTLRTYMHLY